MRTRIGESRGLWLVVGVFVGLGIAYFWPHEPINADQADRNEKFGMISTGASSVGGEAIFILDYLTGRLQGYFLSPRAGVFTQMYYRDVATDFNVAKVKGGLQPVYSFVGGLGHLSGRGITWGGSIIYVAELTTGTLIAYGFPYVENNRPVPPQEMQIIDTAEFRKAALQ